MRTALGAAERPEERPVVMTLEPADPIGGIRLVRALDDDVVLAWFEHSADALVVLDADRRILAANPATEALFGYSPPELEGRHVEMLLPGPELSARMADQGSAQVAGDLETGRHVVLSGAHRNGGAFPVCTTLCPLRTRIGSLALAVMHRSTGVAASPPADTSFQQELAGVVFRGEGLSGIATALRRRTGFEVTVEDVVGRLICTDDGAVGEGRSCRIARGSLDDRYPDAPHLVRTRDGLHWIAVARPEANVLAVVALDDRAGRASESDLRALEQAAAAATMEQLRERAVAEAELSVWGDLASELIEGADLERAANHARSLGYEVDRPHRVVLVQPAETGDLRGLSSAMRRLATHLGLGMLLMTLREDALVLLLGEDLNWQQLAVLLAAESGTAPRLGIGSLCEPAALRNSLRDARLALQLSSQLGRGGLVAEFDELGVWRLFAQCSGTAELRELVQRWVGPLVTYDQQHGSELLKTLRVYLNLSGVLEAAASTLFVHRNTLKYRLGRIADLTGCNLGDPEQRFHLDLACRAWTTLQALGSL